jgi:predicted MPP superfamily phosphohydrolase
MTAVNGVLLLLAAAGHAELWVALINRLHALPIPPERLRRIRHLHDLTIPGGAFAILLGLGLTGPRLLVGGSWNEVSGLWYLILLPSWLGAVGAFWGIARSHLTRRCRSLVSSREQVHEIRRENGARPVDPGPYHRLATLPLNEQCSVSISHKVFEHPRLPANWSGLRILHLSDWHFEGTIGRDYFERVAELSAREPVNLVVFTGDLLDHQRGLDWLPTTLGRLTAPLGCWFILGNHDWSYSNPEDVRRRLRDIGWQFAAPGGVAIPFRSGTLHLAGDETPWLGEPAEFDDRDLDPKSPQFRILLSHTPDHLTRARQMDVNLMLAGHTHGGQIMLPLIGPVYSPSRNGTRHASGEFWQSPTLLHVSRGLSGRHPLRWRCRPEVTVVELQHPATKSN